MSRYNLGSISTTNLVLRNILDMMNNHNDLTALLNQPLVILGKPGSGRKVLAEQIKKNCSKLAKAEVRHFDLSEIQDPSFQFKPAEQQIIVLAGQNLSDHDTQVFLSAKATVLQVPDLNQRSDDIISLVEFFIEVFALMNGCKKLELTESARNAVKTYTWTGQVLELEQVIEKACERATARDSQTISSQDLGISEISPEETQFQVGMKLDEIERKFILQTLYFAENNRTKAAEILGISIRTLRNKINQYKQEGYL